MPKKAAVVRGFTRATTTYERVYKKDRLLVVLTHKHEEDEWSFAVYRAKYARREGWTPDGVAIGIGGGFEEPADAREEAELAVARFKL